MFKKLWGNENLHFILNMHRYLWLCYHRDLYAENVIQTKEKNNMKPIFPKHRIITLNIL